MPYFSLFFFFFFYIEGKGREGKRLSFFCWNSGTDQPYIGERKKRKTAE